MTCARCKDRILVAKTVTDSTGREVLVCEECAIDIDLFLHATPAWKLGGTE